MTNVINSGEAVRIQVIQHCSGEGGSQCCKFSVDPQLTSLSVLHNLVARAFKISREFETSYLARDDRLPEAVWLPLLSDFDLELAFTRSSEPHLLVKVEFGRSGSASGGSVGGVNVWGEGLDLIPRLPLPDLTAAAVANNYSARLPGLFREKMEKTIGLMQKALNWPDELGGEGGVPGQGGVGQQPPPPLDDKRFQSFLDNVGVLERADDLRQTVYLTGLEPSLRKVAWKHLLDVYPAGLTGRERLDYMKTKSQEYYALRDTWQQHVKKTEGQACEEVLSISNMVRKDVLRTDRQHPYFSGPDDNPNTTALYNILTTYSLNHPSVGYCQGMSDLASPLLVTQRDEAHAYVCFCALMTRTHPNFHIDGVAMSLKFQHLSEALIYYDPEFYIYLQEHQADDLLFCYRWLLLELKREFAFDEAQLMLEVLWASLPSRPPQDGGIQLCQVAFNPSAALQAAAAGVTTSPTNRGIAAPAPPSSSALAAARLAARVTRISNYGTVCALRRQRSSEAAVVLSRYTRNVRSALGGGRALTRTHSQPTHACLTRGSLPAISPAVEATASTVLSSASSTPADEEGDVGCKWTTRVQAKVLAATDVRAVLSPLSDDVFLSDAPAIDAAAARTMDASTNAESCDVDEAEWNVTPTRKIKNLKEFMELGKGSRGSDGSSNPGSPSKSPIKNVSRSPRKVNSSSINKVVPNYLNIKCGERDTPNCIEPGVNPVSCTRVNSDHNTVTTTTSNVSDATIPSYIAASRHSDACTGPIPGNSKANCKLYGYLTVDNRKFPPSGLSPIESPCEDTLNVAFDKMCSANGNQLVPASSECCADLNSSVPVTIGGLSPLRPTQATTTNACAAEPSTDMNTSLRVSPGCVSSCSPTHCPTSAANVMMSNSSTSTTLASSSSCSSALYAAEITRRCFSESDAGLGMMLDDDVDCVPPHRPPDEDDDEQLCVEVWENPLASSPIRSENYAGTGPTKTTVLPESSTEGDIAKLLASRDGSSKNHNHISAKFVSNQRIPFENSSSSDTTDTTFNSSNGKYAATAALPPSDSNKSSNRGKGLGSTANTGWTVSLGGASSASSPPSKLAPPLLFGGGNPFLMIVCVTILLQHRNFIISQRLDHNDLAMHFDKMVRKHNVHNVLRQARLRYQHYLSLHEAGSGSGHEAC